MTREAFEKSLRAFSKRTPFMPFAVELVSGTRITVDHPEALMFRGGIAVYFDKTDSPSLFDHEGVAQIVDAPSDSRAAARQRR